MITSGVTKELADAVVDYYSYLGDKGISLIRLLRYKSVPHGIMIDELLVRFTDKNGDEMSSICSYDGIDGKLWDAKRPNISEQMWDDRSDEDHLIECVKRGM